MPALILYPAHRDLLRPHRELTGDGRLEGEAVDPPVVDYPDVPRLDKLSQIYHKLIFMRVCQVFQHQQCANGLLDQHTILTIVHQPL